MEAELIGCLLTLLWIELGIMCPRIGSMPSGFMGAKDEPVICSCFHHDGTPIQSSAFSSILYDGRDLEELVGFLRDKFAN